MTAMRRAYALKMTTSKTTAVREQQ